MTRPLVPRTIPRTIVSLAVFVASSAVIARASAQSAQSAQDEGAHDTPPPPPATTDGENAPTNDASHADAAAPPPSPPPPASLAPAAPETPAMRYPVSRAARPLTLARLLLVPDLDLDSTEWPVGRFTNATFGAAFGILDDLSVRAGLVPLQLTSPNRATGGFRYGETTDTQGPYLSATYRFVHGDVVEVGAAAGGIALTAYDISGYRVWAAVPIRAHVTQSLRLDASPQISYTHETDETHVTEQPVSTAGQISVFPVATSVTTANHRTTLFFPVSTTWNVTDAFHVGAHSGLVLGNLSDVKNTAHVPVGIYGGYTFAGSRGPILDIDPYFEFPGLFRFAPNQKTTQTDWNVVGVTVRGFVDLL